MVIAANASSIGFFDALRRLTQALPPAAAWSVFVLLAGLFVFIAAFNAIVWWQQFVLKREKTASVGPFIGGFLGYTAMRVSPVEAMSNYAWLALIFDVGCGPTLVLGVVGGAPGIWRTSRFNLLHEYRGHQGNRTVHLRLFRREIFTIEKIIHRSPGTPGLTNSGTSGRWRREGDRLTLHRGAIGDSAVFAVVPGQPSETLRQSSGFPGWETNPESSLAGIDLVLKR